MATEEEIKSAYYENSNKTYGSTSPSSTAGISSGGTYTPITSKTNKTYGSPSPSSIAGSTASGIYTPNTKPGSPAPSNTSSSTGTSGVTGGSANTSPSTSRTDAINQMYDAQADARRQQLQSAYDRQMSDAQAAADKIPQTYQQQANALATEYERDRRNMNMQAAGNGINTGTASQQALALNSAYQRDYGNIGRAQADAQAEAQRGMANLTAQYESDIQSALAQNDYQRAAALLNEYNNADSRNLKNAQILAEFGDFSGYANLYGQEQADNMLAIWRAQNPELAYMTGSITQAQRDNLVNRRPMNEGLDESGNRIAGTGGGGGGGGAYWDAYNAAVSRGLNPYDSEDLKVITGFYL